jgi:ankyrin repeat protein
MKTLHDAVRRRKHKLIRQLVEAGHDPNAFNEEGLTPVHVAASHGHFDVIHTLVSVGAQVEAPNAHGETVLSYCASNNYLEAIDKLVTELGADPKRADRLGITPVHSAAAQGAVEAIRLLARLGARVDTPNKEGATPVYVAAQHGQAEAIRALASLGAALDTPSNFGITPLGIAVEQGHLEVIRVLAELRANVGWLGSRGETLIYLAAQYNRAEAILLLASLGVDARASIPGSGETPLHIAAYNGHVEAIRALVISLGVSVHTPMANGGTAVHVAAQQGHAEAVRALITLGASAEAPMTQSVPSTPPHIAAQFNQAAVIHALANLGINLDVSDRGITPLTTAVKNGQVEAIRALIGAGVSPYARVLDISALFYLACAHPGRDDVIVALLENPNYKVLKHLYKCLLEPESFPPVWTAESAAKFRAAIERELPHMLITRQHPTLFFKVPSEKAEMSSALALRPVAADLERMSSTTAPKLHRSSRKG